MSSTEPRLSVTAASAITTTTTIITTTTTTTTTATTSTTTTEASNGECLPPNRRSARTGSPVSSASTNSSSGASAENEPSVTMPTTTGLRCITRDGEEEEEISLGETCARLPRFSSTWWGSQNTQGSSGRQTERRLEEGTGVVRGGKERREQESYREGGEGGGGGGGKERLLLARRSITARETKTGVVFAKAFAKDRHCSSSNSRKGRVDCRTPLPRPPRCGLPTMPPVLALFVAFVAVLAVLVPGAFASAASAFTTSRLTSASYDQWVHEVTLDSEGAFVVQWTPAKDHILFRVTAQTRGYIGFGLASYPRMDGADIVVGWVHSGKAYLQDRHGRGNEEPEVDEQQDWMLVGGYENDTHTVLHMSRHYNTCDKKDHVISNDTVRVLWAFHPDDPVDPESPSPRLHYHSSVRRGSRSLFLLERGPDPASTARGVPTRSWVLLNPEVSISGEEDTTYWCKMFKRPKMLERNHIIRYEPVFSPGNEGYLHHIIVYECSGVDADLEVAFEELSSTSGHQCYQSSMSPLIYTCNHVIVAWAIGSEGLTLPPEAGYPLNPEGPKYYMMEVHYDNPQHHFFTDSSGIRIIYTPELRAHDAGVLSVGLDPNWKHLIPPRQRTVLSEGHCIGECTTAALPSSGINVFAAILHTHLLGRKVRVRHIRGDRELEPIAQDNNYDFNYQEYRALPESRRVMPGDHLIGECTYNSRERTTITLGGFKTRDEMCLSFLFYWPHVDLSLCHSLPSLNTVLHSLGIQKLSEGSNPITIRRPVELAGKTLEWRLMNYDWKNQFEYFQHATHTGTFKPMCWWRGQSLIPELEKEDYAYPNITEPYELENECRRKRRKNRRRKNKDRSHNHHFFSHEFEDESFQDGEEIMIDDETDTKPIERIDVDPFRSINFHMPITHERTDKDWPRGHSGEHTGGDFGTSDWSIGINNNFGGQTEDNIFNLGNVNVPDRELAQEFDQMERELEQEMANLVPNNFQEEQQPQQHRPTQSSTSTGLSSSQPWILWTLALGVTIALSNEFRFHLNHG
ncbi:MOXD1 homolog 2-like [Oratosquilla oratoria]|uniref:MOXD1 homolog 2-like n=1 Tax=Oratosquilla oratoria TaxID=337810 RepID=UPI003F76563A